MDIVETIHVYYPGSGYSIVNNDYDRLTWYDTTVPKPTKEELLEKWEHVKVKIPWKPLRQERNRRLAEVDWIFTSDYDLSVSDHAAWMAYRKALRDLPSTTEDPANPVWPEKPPLPKGETLTLKMSDTVISGKSQITLLQNVVYNLTKRIEALENA
jgi:hypothetical protein